MHHNKKILIILTNVDKLSEQHETLSEKRTGFDVKSVAYLWKTFHEKKKVTVDICTPKGGETQMDPDILQMSKDDPIVQEFLKDRKTVDQFKDTSSIRDMTPEDYCLIALTGGHGSMIDFPKTPELTKFLTKVACRQHRGSSSTGSNTSLPNTSETPIIATIGHGIAGLMNVKTGQHGGGSEGNSSDSNTSLESILTTGEYYLKNKRVTCFSNEEERKINYEKVIPFSLEDKLKSIGAKVEVGSPFEEKVVREGKCLITAQNPNSAKKWVETIMELFRED